MVFELIALGVGIWYGYSRPGKEDKSALFKKGLMFALILGVVFAIIGYFIPFSGLGLVGASEGMAVFVMVVITWVIYTLLFMLGAWIGDKLEERKKGTQA